MAPVQETPTPFSPPTGSRWWRSRCRWSVGATLPSSASGSHLLSVSLAGSARVGDAAFDQIFHPIAERLLERCDAVLRVGGASQGADLMVQVARQRGLAVYSRLQEIPGCEGATTPPIA